MQDMDLYDESRTLVFSGTLARNNGQRRIGMDGMIISSPCWIISVCGICTPSSFLQKLNIFFGGVVVLTREETQSNGVVNRLVGSRYAQIFFYHVARIFIIHPHMQPIPLEYLRLGEFSESSESRKSLPTMDASLRVCASAQNLSTHSQCTTPQPSRLAVILYTLRAML